MGRGERGRESAEGGGERETQRAEVGRRKGRGEGRERKRERGEVHLGKGKQ